MSLSLLLLLSVVVFEGKLIYIFVLHISFPVTHTGTHFESDKLPRRLTDWLQVKRNTHSYPTRTYCCNVTGIHTLARIHPLGWSRGQSQATSGRVNTVEPCATSVLTHLPVESLAVPHNGANSFHHLTPINLLMSILFTWLLSARASESVCSCETRVNR